MIETNQPEEAWLIRFQDSHSSAESMRDGNPGKDVGNN
jgi:hypothetical protein